MRPDPMRRGSSHRQVEPPDQFPPELTEAIPDGRVSEIEQTLQDAGVAQGVIDTVVAALTTQQDVRNTVDQVITTMQDNGVPPDVQFPVLVELAEGIKDQTTPAVVRAIENNPVGSAAAVSVISALFSPL